MSSSEEYSGSSDDSGSGAQEHNSQQEESFDMYEDDPMHSPSNDYLEKLKARFRKVCEEKKDWQKRQECWNAFETSLGGILLSRQAEGWYGPPSDSYRFEGDELFSGFAFHNKQDDLLMPWDFPTRKEIEQHFSKLKHVSYVHKTGLFGQTINKFVQKTCQGCVGSKKEPVIIDLPPSTRQKPILTRIVERQDDNADMHWPLYLMGHDTVLAAKPTEIKGVLSPLFFGQDSGIHQVICFDITFVGSPLPPKNDEVCPYSRFYNCTFDSYIGSRGETMFIDCQGKGMLIWGAWEIRMLNCKFESVTVAGGRLLAKGCEFGELHLADDCQRASLYFLDDCKVGEKCSGPLKIVVSRSWPDPEADIREAFQEMEEKAFQPLGFRP